MSFDSSAGPRREPGWFNRRLRLPRYFAVIFVLAGAGLFALGLWLGLEGWRSRGWPATPGRIVRSEAARMGRTWTVNLHYTYEVGGWEYSGGRLFLGPEAGMSQSRALEYVRRYPAGAAVEVHYDPEAPQFSVLEPGPTRGTALLVFMGLLFGLLGGAAYNHAAREREGAARAGVLERRSKWLAVGLAATVAAVIFWGLLPDLRSSLRELGRPEPAGPPPGPETGPALSDFSEEDAGPTGESSPRGRLIAARDFSLKAQLARREARSVRVSLREDFVPADDPGLGAGHATNQLSSLPPEGLEKEPPSEGEDRRYGRLVLGARDNRDFLFILDRIETPHPVLYLDLDQDGDLTDDGPPLENQSEGRFAAEIRIPFPRLVEGYGGAEDFRLWFYTDEALWKRGLAWHSSRTIMKGRVRLDGGDRLAAVAEQEAPDGDFTNDGLYVDLDGDGKLTPGLEYVGIEDLVRFEDRCYRFIVAW
ncbi:MAG: DUF3592 domain-containing protein [Thermodesulfobacteriota bacterium]